MINKDEFKPHHEKYYQEVLQEEGTSTKTYKHEKNDEKYEGINEEVFEGIKWSNLIFLPFNPVFKMLVIVSVIIKTILGPIQSVYPIVYCWDVMAISPVLTLIKFLYLYVCDPLYGIDTFLHIIHRQVTDKRAHLPKSAFLLLLDILSLIPFTRLLSSEECPPFQFWQNIMAFNEFLIIYRVLEYFSLVTTHTTWKLIIGFTLMMAIGVNCVGCFWILLTKQGLCKNCRDGIYDWRIYIIHKLNETEEAYTTYIYSMCYVLSFALHTHVDEFKPSTIAEFMIICVFVAIGYILLHFILVPKLFSESILTLSRICSQYANIKKVLEETKRRNSRSAAHKKVDNFYQIMWEKRNGIVDTPLFFIKDIPRYLRLELQQDLLWQVFYHSPTLRNTSVSFQRWLSDKVFLHHKLPGERFYVSPHDNMQCNYYFIKSGIVQLISADDGSTPILTVTSGTVFGDVNFLVPHLTDKVTIRCLTFCEYYILSRENLLYAMYNYQDDRKLIIESVKERLKHAKTLFTCKQYIRGVDRSEDEGIAWIKRRWWELFALVSKWRKTPDKKCEIPREHTSYHCPKYLGQLVLCTETELQTTLFSNVKFPWILAPQSSFGIAWRRIVLVTVFLVLCLFPPNLIKSWDHVPVWFKLFSLWVNLVYAVDIGVSLSTAVKKEGYVIANFSEVMSERCKSLDFILDVMATIWLEDIFYVCGLSQYYTTAKFNRLIKIYKLFYVEYFWDIKTSPMIIVIWNIFLLQFASLIIVNYLVYEVGSYIRNVTLRNFPAENLCHKTNSTDIDCDSPIIGVSFMAVFEITFSVFLPRTLNDIYLLAIESYVFTLISIYCKGRLIAYLYLKDRDEMNYRYFVLNLKEYCKDYRVPQDLFKKLDQYSTCHWKYYKGINIMQPHKLTEEPFEIFWKCQGEAAENIIARSKAFVGADSALIKDLACAVKLLTLPKNATVFLFGSQCKKVVWVLQGYVKSEYYDEDGQLEKKDYGPGCILSLICVFFGKPSIRTYTTYTDCEFLFIDLKDFYAICKRYPHEWSCIQKCINKYRPQFEDMFQNFLIKHKENKQKRTKPNIKTGPSQSLPFEGDLWGRPESAFMQTWLVFRVAVVCISITAASLQGSIGDVYGWPLHMIGALCDSIAWVDIILKLFLHYNDARGILITSKVKCLLNYLTKGFFLDIIGAVPWLTIIKSLISHDVSETDGQILNMVSKFAHLYIVFAYFKYISDIPTANMVSLMITKWIIVNILLLLGVSHYLVVKCVDMEYDLNMNLVSITKRNACWIPVFWNLPQNLSLEDLKLIFAESLDFANCGLTRMNLGRFSIVDREIFGVEFVLYCLNVLSWFVMCYISKLLLLSSRGDTIAQNDVDQLTKFLKSERIDKKLIAQAVNHFKYCWMRSKGVNIHQLTNDRIGAVFGQDLSYYFFRQTFSVLDTLLQGGDQIQRQLASHSKAVYYKPGQDITREMDLNTDIYVVHRGKVHITKNGNKITTLTKGDVFGQLQGTKLRPIKIAAQTADYVDLLEIKVKTFQEIITDEVRKTIAENSHSKSDFMATNKIFVENPYDTVQYILRGKKRIKLPRARKMTVARRGNWYSRWLYMTWFCGPFVTSIIVVMLGFLPPKINVFLYGILIALDFLHVANFVAEFYSMDLVVKNNKCVYHPMGSRLFSYWFVHIDLLSVLAPLATVLIINDWRFQLARLWRLRLFYNFDFHFCRGFKVPIY